MMMECDTLLMVGSSFPYSQFLPPFGQGARLQIDIDGKMIGIRYPMELNLVGDARETLREMLPLVDTKSNSSWRKKIEGEIRQWWQVVEARAHDAADPLNPQRVFWDLSPASRTTAF